MRVRAWSMTCSVCTQTSPSGCHSGSCGQPTSACSSGNSRATMPRSSASARPIDGRGASSSFSNSPQIRSAGRSSSGIDRHSSRVPRVERRTRSARRTEPRAARAGCRRRTSRDRRRAGGGVAGRRGRRTDRGTPPVSGSQAMALIREVAPPRGFLEGHVRIAGDVEAAVAAAGLRFAARQRHVDVADLVDLKALADGFDAAEAFEQRAHAVGRQAEHLEVDVRRASPAHQPVAHPAADDQRAAAGLADRLGDGAGRARRRCHSWLREAAFPRDRCFTGWRPYLFTSRSQKPGAIAFSSTRPRDFVYG